jgi:hypothetical protein
MSARPIIHASRTRAQLDQFLDASPPHLRPIIETVRDHGVAMLFVGQSPDSFRIPDHPKQPAIVLIGDDMDRAIGPDGFHMPSVRRAIRACSAFAVVSSAPQTDVYSAIAATAAITRHSTMLIETRPEQELAWVGLIQKLAPRRFIWLATVEGGHA